MAEEPGTLSGTLDCPGQAGGNHDPRNDLNDLTGAAWVYFLNSVDVTHYPTTGPESYGHDLRRVHPSPKPPQLMARYIEFFTQRGGWVLDPFAGVGGTLLGCGLLTRQGRERHAVGVELSARYVEIYRRVCEREGLPEQTMICGDARDLLRFPAVTERIFDLILTDPPYADMMARPRSGEQRKRIGHSTPRSFSHSEADLGNLDRDIFLDALQGVLESALTRLRPKGHMVVFCKDLQPTEDEHNMLHVYLTERLMTIPGLRFRGYKIWTDQVQRLYPFGYPYTFVANQLHQFALIFRKEG